jgi:excisionase family DNA binding protein
LSSTGLSRHERLGGIATAGKTPIVYSFDEAADICGVSRRTLYRWADKGKGPPIVRMGRRIGILDRDLTHWLLKRRENINAA